ncbi:MAG: Hpt domain-containing protein [Pseudomonadota bacterium]|nr:Hpt domain-containing protein [Pseudomonadota bacterium]
MIDWNRINELRDEIGEEDFADVAQMFLVEVDAAIEQLRTAPELDSLAEDLHFLKGSAINLGFSAFAELCASGEYTARESDPSEVDVVEVVKCYDKSRVLFIESPLICGAA